MISIRVGQFHHPGLGCIDRISQGLDIATQCQPILPILWQQQFARNLEELRAELGIRAVKDGLWSW